MWFLYLYWLLLAVANGGRLFVGDSFEEEVACAVCHTLVNEIEGLPRENWTRYEIEQYLTQEWCSGLAGSAQVACDVLVSALPMILEFLDSELPPAQVCVDLTLCDYPPVSLPDPAPMPIGIINLDLPPAQRWGTLWSQPQFQPLVMHFLSLMKAVVPAPLYSALLDAGQVILDNVDDEYAQEMTGGAAALGIPAPLVGLLNAAYEITDVCTSIVAQDTAGQVFHARNLDFAFSMYGTELLRNLSVQVAFQSGNRTLYYATMYIGYVGVLTGMRPGGFSISVDTRFNPGGLFAAILQMAEVLGQGTATMNSHLVRDTLFGALDFDAALSALSGDIVVSDIYYIVAGTQAGQGAVIARNATAAEYIQPLDPALPDGFFTFVTNYDMDETPPWWDNRVAATYGALVALGQGGVSLPGLMSVLDVKPVLNRLTTLTVLMQPETASYTSLRRACPDPCPF